MQTPAVEGEGLEGLDGGRRGKLVAIGRCVYVGKGSYWTWESLRTGKLMGSPPLIHTPRVGLIQMIGNGEGES